MDAKVFADVGYDVDDGYLVGSMCVVRLVFCVV